MFRLSFQGTLFVPVVVLLLCSTLSKVCRVVCLMLQVGGVFIRVFNQRGRSSANASNATVTAATATAAVAAAAPAAAAGNAAHAGPLSVQPSQQQQRGSGGGAAAFAGAAAGSGSGTPSDPSGFCKALVRYLYDRLVERCFRGAELQQLSGAEARNVLDVVTALSGGAVAGELHTHSVRN